MDPFRDALFVDIETASLADLRQTGAWVYSRHPSTHVYCVSFGGNGDTFDVDTWQPGDDLSDRLVEFIRAGGQVVAHNVGFEQAIWENILVPEYGFPRIDPLQWSDTQAMGLALSLPATLDGLGAALGCTVQKDQDGAELMRSMATAVEEHSGFYLYPEATRMNMSRLIHYCETDVRTTRECYQRMRHLSTMEHRVWLVDQRINRRGVFLDRGFARKCQSFAKQRRRVLDTDVYRATGDLLSATAPPALKRWLKDRGVVLPKRHRGQGRVSESLDQQAMEELLAGDLQPDVRNVLEHRLEAARVTSLAKLNRVASMADPDDGRLRFVLQYHGAHTGRWTSHGLQLHNLPKVKLSPVDLDLARTIVERGDVTALGMFFSRPLRVLSQLLRSTVSAPPGRELIAGDYSAIEARVVAWLAGQGDVLDLFRIGEDVYSHAARKVGSDNRQLGKVCTLALGYGMGPVKFAGTAAAWDVPLELKEAKRITAAWRERNDAIVRFWHCLEEAAYSAVRTRGETFHAGPILCLANDYCLSLRLPSGRHLHYWRPVLLRTTKQVPIVNDAGEVEKIEIEGTELSFYATGRDKKTMTRNSTYGGKLVENVTQAVARDLLAAALIRLENVDPYEVVVHVHDSLACEVPAGEGDVDEFCALMSETPKWAAGLPVAVDGYRDTRFRG